MFISVCGLEGASKSTSINTIKQVCEQQGMTPVVVREPGGTPIAEAIRTVHKADHLETMHLETELLLMFAARHQLYKNVIAPALQDGSAVVIADRSWWCTYAYQIHQAASPDTRHLFWELKRQFTDPLMHDAVLYLDVNPDVGMARARGRGALDRIEQKDMAFFHRAREGYLTLLNSQPHASMVDANGELDAVQDTVATWTYTTLQSQRHQVFDTF